MKQLLVIPFSFLLAFLLSVNSYSQDKKADLKKKTETTETKVVEKKQDVTKKIEQTKMKVVDNKPVNSICPVSGEEIEDGITTTYNGKTYAVCCKSCLKKFNKDPEKYISKLSEDGKSLKENK